MSDIQTAGGTRIFIGPVGVDDTFQELTAASPYVEIGLVESIGEVGNQASDVKYVTLADNRTQHGKGARDGGIMTLTCGHDPTDIGQTSLRTAMILRYEHAFKIVLPDSFVLFFVIKVMSSRQLVGANDNIIRSVFNCGIQSDVFIQEPLGEAEEIVLRDGRFMTDRGGEQIVTRGI